MATNAPRYANLTPRRTIPTPKGVRLNAASGRWGPQSPKGRNTIAQFQRMHRYQV